MPEPPVDVAFAQGRGRGLRVGACLVARVVRLDGADAGKRGVAAPVVGVCLCSMFLKQFGRYFSAVGAAGFPQCWQCVGRWLE